MRNYTTTESDMINSYLSTHEVTLCPTQYNTKDTGTSTKDTLGEQITTQMTPDYYYNKDEELIGIRWESKSWSNGMDLKAFLNHRDMLPYLKKTVWFRLKLKLTQRKTKALKRQIRRDKAKALNNVTKSNKILQPSRQRRAKPTPPSKR